MIDLVQVRSLSGSGGNGAVSFRHEKYVANGGPDGGDGGNGGSVVFEADEGVTTLAHVRHRRVYKAEHGKPGSGNHRHGGNGKSLIIKVPVGTVIKVMEGEQSWDLDQAGTRVVVARGGGGGKGNVRFANSIRQAPNFAEKGMPGEDLNLQLELKLLADVGLVGLPNAGKSTLLRAVSNAVPDVGAFPFTTLEPVLGVVDVGMTSFVMADLPGLIEGAHEGVGLGHQFLRHVERTRVLVHMLDASDEDPVANYETIRRELALYDESLAEKPEIIALNKVDLPEARDNAEKLKDRFSEREVHVISGATSEGVQDLVRALLRILQETAPVSDTLTETHDLPVLRPQARDRLEVVKDDGVFVITGHRAEEAALKLGEGGYEAQEELQERMRRMGLDRTMKRLGGKPGDRIRIGAVEMDWNG